MSVKPTNIELTGDDALLIEWSDGTRRRYRFEQLRQRCPCATCREKRKAAEAPAGLLPILSPEETEPLKVQGMTPVGNYAYSIQFSDGHDTGIYTFELLFELGEAL